jgi:hypothetical protein
MKNMNSIQELSFPARRIEAKTAEDAQSIETADGLRRWLRSRSCPIIRASLRQAECMGLSGEETYARLAYNALVALEKMQEDYMRHVNTCCAPLQFSK